MTKVFSTLDKDEDGTSLVLRAKLEQLAGVAKHLTRTEFDVAVVHERERITNNGEGIYLPDEPCSIAGEAGTRRWILGGSAALSHWRTVEIGALRFVLSADANACRLVSGAPASGLGIDGDRAYNYVAQTLYGKASGAWSVLSVGAPGLTEPGAPTIGVATGGNAQASVAFTAPANNGGAAITGYRVTASTGQTATGASSPITVSGLTNGAAVTFTVQAQNSVGYGAASAASNSVTPTAVTTVPGAPTGVTAVPGNASATVSWVAPANNGGSPITGYIVTPSVGAAVTVGAVLSAVVSGLTNGTPVNFTVRAINAIGTGAQSSGSSSVTPEVGLGGTEFLADSFEDATGVGDSTGNTDVLLVNHTPQVGGAWAKHPSAATGDIRFDALGTGVYCRTATAVYSNAAVPPSANYFVEADIEFRSEIANDRVGVAGRLDETANTFYWVQWTAATGYVLNKIVAGTVTALGNFTATFTSGVRKLRLTMDGSTITASVDGVVVITATDASITAAGHAGIRIALAQTRTTGVHIGNVRAVTI